MPQLKLPRPSSPEQVIEPTEDSGSEKGKLRFSAGNPDKSVIITRIPILEDPREHDGAASARELSPLQEGQPYSHSGDYVSIPAAADRGWKEFGSPSEYLSPASATGGGDWSQYRPHSASASSGEPMPAQTVVLTPNTEVQRKAEPKPPPPIRVHSMILHRL